MTPPPVAQRTEARETPAVEPRELPSNVVEFPADEDTGAISVQAQDYGLIFAAHRSVGRVADQLERTPVL